MLQLIGNIKNQIGIENLAEKAEIQNQESLTYRVWKVARNFFISSVFFWYVSQPFFIAGILFGAILYRGVYKETTAFAENIFTWWEMTGWIKRLAAGIFAIVSFPFWAKYGSFLWAANIASDEITRVVRQKQGQQIPFKGEDEITQVVRQKQGQQIPFKGEDGSARKLL